MAKLVLDDWETYFDNRRYSFQETLTDSDGNKYRVTHTNLQIKAIPYGVRYVLLYNDSFKKAIPLVERIDIVSGRNMSVTVFSGDKFQIMLTKVLDKTEVPAQISIY